MKWVTFAVITFVMMGCSTATESIPPLNATDATAVTFQADWNGHPQEAAWSRFVLSALESVGQNLLATTPTDAQEFCPAFASLDRDGRRQFYLALISSMARYESSFDPSVSFQESFNDAQGNPVISRGLLQLSVESANAYSGCLLDRAEELHDPETNLTCGVAILDRLIGRDQVIGGRVNGRWRGGAAYWSVLRQTSSRRQQITNFTRTIDACRI